MNSLETTMRIINEYYESEFNHGADFSDMTAVGLAYTTVSDKEIDVQVYADLVNLRVYTYASGDKLIDEKKFNTVEEFNKWLEWNLDFCWLTSYDFEEDYPEIWALYD